VKKLRQVLIILIRIKRIRKFILFIGFISALGIFALTSVSASELEGLEEYYEEIASNSPRVSLELENFTSPEGASDSVNIIIFLTIIALAPSILVLMTGFTRILIVLSFVRNALGLQQTPPNQVLIGISLFLTIFLMGPVLTDINENALQPYINEELTMDEAFAAAMEPVRGFMFYQLSSPNSNELNTFLDIAGQERPEELEDIGNDVLIPAFIMNEIKLAFIMGFFIYVPFLIIDLVVASTLMSLGMMMLPPAMVSMPFKLILFMLVDGWAMITTTLMGSFL
jgi:flagellar biosynthetic protein FliP